MKAVAARAFPVFLVLLAVFFTWDHFHWVRADVVPHMDSDSSLHGGSMAGGWFRVQHEWSAATLYAAGTYPPLVHWVTWLYMWLTSPSLSAMREAQAVYSGVLALGCGLLARRIWGGWAGLAAACLCFTFPTMYWQRSIILLALAETAMLGLAYGLLADPRAPARGGFGWARLLAGGVSMGLASLTHVSMLYWLAATGATQVLFAAWGLFRRHEGARAHARDLVVYYGIAALIGAPWYWISRVFIFGALRTNYEVETWEQSPYDIPVFLGWLREHFMAAPTSWAFVAGLVCLPFLHRSAAVVLPVLAGMVGGYLGVLSYPHVHARYFLPLVPMLMVVATAPIGLLTVAGRWALPRQVLAAALALAMAGYGVVYTVGWRWSERGPRTADLTVDGAISGPRIQYDRQAPWQAMLRSPTRYHWFGPRPHTGVWPINDVITRVIQELRLPAAPASEPTFGALPRAPIVWALSPHLADRTTTFEYVVRGIRPPMVVEERVPLQELERLEGEGRAAYVLYTKNLLRDPPGTTVIETWPVYIPERIVTELVFARVDGGMRAVYEKVARRTPFEGRPK